METFYIYRENQIVQMQGVYECTRHHRRIYKVGDEKMTGYKSKRAARIARSDQRARDIRTAARRKVQALRIKDMKRLQPAGCTRFIDWCKWIIMYDGIPPDAERVIEFHRVDEYFTQFEQGQLSEHIRKRKSGQLQEPPSKRRRRLFQLMASVDESKLEDIENTLDTLLQST